MWVRVYSRFEFQVGHSNQNTILTNNKNATLLPLIELVSKELNHFGVIVDLFRQIGGHTVIVVYLCYFALFEDFSL